MAKDKVIHGGTIDLGLNLKSESVEAKLKDIVGCLDIIQQSNQLDLKFKNIKGVSTFIQNLAKLDEKLDDIKTSANVAGDELSKSMSKSASKVVEDITSMSAKSADLTRELKSLSEMKDLSTAQDKVKKIAKSINASLSFVDPGNLIDVDELLNVKDSQKQLDILSEGLKNFTTGWTSLGQSGIRATDELRHGLAGSSGEADNLQKKLTSIKSLLDEINGNSFKTRVNRIKSDKLDSAKPTRNQEPANLISNAFSDYTDAVGVLKNDSATIEEKTKAYIQLTNAVHDLGWAIEELPDDVDSVLGKKGATQIEEMLDNYRDNYLKLIDSIKKDLQQEINVVMGVEPTVDPNVDGKVKKAVEGSIPEQIEVDTGVKIDVTATIKQLDELLIKFRELKDNKDKTGAVETANEIAKLTLSLQDCGVEFDAIKNQLSASNKRTFSSNAIKDAISQTNELRSHVPEVSAEFDKLNRLLGENFVGKEKFTDIFDAVKKGTIHAEDAYKTIKAAQDEIVKGDAASDVEKLTSALKKTFNTDEIKSGWKTTIAEVESGKVKWIDALTEITKAELDFNNIQNKAIKKDSKKYQNQAEKAQQEAAEANERAKKAEERAEELQKELNKQKQTPSPTPAAPTPQKIKQQIRDSYSGMLYHGSKSPMTNETYDPSKNKLSNRNLGVGLYFTPDLELASKYGKNILQQNVNLDKIFVLTKDFITDVDALYKAMGKVKPENADWDTIKKDLHGAMMIAENAKAFTKNMQEMGYQGVYSKGYGFADPEVEQLAIYDEKYHQNLTTTPYKDIKKQAEGAAQALEQIEQQEKDIAKAAKEREEIQRKANETPKYSGTGTGIGTGVGTSGASVKAEMEDLNLLDKKVKEVAEVIRNTKTKAFQDEATVVNTSVQKEMEDLDLLIGKLKDVQKEASIELTVSNENPHILTDPNGNVVTGYRGLKGSYGGLVSGRYHGGTFVTNKKSLAQQYAGENGKIEVVNLSMKNPFEFEGNGRLWNQLRFEGHGENDISRRLSVIREEIKRLFAKIDEGRKKNENTQQYSNKIKELEAERKAIYDDKSNPYGMYDTNKMVEYAKSQGYDGVIFKNIIDSVTGSAEDISDIFVVFNEKQIHYLETLKSAADSIEESQNKIQAEKQETLAAVASDGSSVIAQNDTGAFTGNQEQVQGSFSDLKTSSDNVRDAFTGIEISVKNLKEAVDNAVNGINAKVANIDVVKNFGVNSSDNVNLSTYDKILEKMKQIVAERKKFVDVKDDDRLDDILDYKNLIHKKDTHLKPEAAEHQLREIIEAIKYISTLDLSVSLPKHLYDEDHSFKDRKLVDIEHLAKGSDSTFINNWDELIGALQARCLNLLEVINSNDGALERFLSVDDKNVLLSFGIDKLTEDLEEYIATQQQMNKSNKDVRSGIEDITRDILAMARALDISEKDFSSLEYYLHTLTNPLQDMASPNEEANYVMSRIDKNWTSKNDQASSKNSSVDSNLSSTLELLNGTLSKMIGSNDPATQGADSDNGLSGIAKNVKSIYEHLRTNPNDKNKIEQNDYKDTTSDNNDENALLSTLNNLDETLSQLQSWINSNINQENDSELTKLTTDVITPLSNAIIELKNAIAIEDDGQQKVEQVEDTELIRTLNNLNESIARMVGSGDPASQNTDPNKGISGIADNVKNIYGILNGRKDNDGDLANSINNAVKELSNASKYIADDAKLRQESNTKYQAASDRISTEAGRKDVLDRIMGQYSNDYFIPDQASTNYTSHTGGIVKVETVLQGLDNKFYDFAATIDSQGVVAVKKMEENGSKSIAVQNQIAEQERKLAQTREVAAKKIKQETAGEYLERKKQESLAKERTISYDIVKPQVDSTIKAYDAFSAQNVANIPANLKNDYNAFLQIIKELKTENRNLSEDEVTAVESFCSGIQKEINNIKEKNAALEVQNTLIKQYESEYDKIYNKIISNDKHDGKTGLDIAKEFYLSRNPNMSDKQLDNISKSMIERSLRNVFNHDPSQGRSLSIKGSKNDWNVLDPDFYLKEYQAYDEILQLIGYHLGEIKPLMIDEKTQWGFTADAIANSDHVILNLEEARNILLSLSETQSVDSNLFGLEDTEKAKKLLDSIKLELNTLQQQDEHGIKLLSVEELESSKQRLKEYTSELQNMIKTANANSTKGSFTKRYDDQLRKSANALNKFKEDTQNINLSADVQNTVSKYEAAIQKLKDMRTAFENTSKGQLTVDQKNQWDEAVNETKEYQKELEKILKIHNKIASDGQIDLNEIDPSINTNNATQMYDAMKKYLEIVYGSGAVIKGVGKDHQSLNATFTDAEGRINEVTIAYNKLNNTLSHHAAPVGQVESAWSKLTTSIGKKVRDMAAYFATFGSVYEVINIIRQGINAVREIDSALTELKKVTNATEAEYNRFLQTMSKTAGIVGSTVKDLTSSAADWARLGYSMQEAGELAATTAKLLNVSEFSSVDDATSALVSTLQAFSKDGENVAVRAEEIVDILNNIGNKYPVATNELATGLATSGAALVAANNSIEEQVALLSAGNATMQDVSTVAAGLKIVAARLRGTTSEVDDDADSAVTNVSKLQKKILALTKDANGGEGINILNEDGGYKSTYEILKEISKVFDKMDDISQASLLELIAGKNRSSVVAAILQNGKILDNAYADALDSAGSSTNELNTYLDSIQGRIDLFKNALQTMWMNFISSDVIKFFVDIGTEIIKLIDKVGVLNSAILAFAGFKLIPAFFKSTGIGSLIKDMFLLTGAFGDLAKTSIVGSKGILALAASTSLAESGLVKLAISLGITSAEAVKTMTATQLLSVGFKALGASIWGTIKAIGAFLFTTPAGWAILATAAITGVIYAYNKFGETHQKFIKDLEKQTEELDKIRTELESVNSELQTTKERIEELENKGPLTFTEQDELNRLREQNNELERQQKILQARDKREQQKQVKTALDAIKTDSNLKDKNIVSNVVVGEDDKATSTVTNVGNKWVQELNALESAKKELDRAESDYNAAVLNSETTDEELKKLEDAVEEKQKIFDEQNEQLDTLQTDWETKYGDVGYIKDATTAEEKAWNEYFRQQQEYINKREWINGNFGKADILNSTFGAYATDSAKAFKEEFEKAIKEGGDPLQILMGLTSSNKEYYSIVSGLLNQYGISMANLAHYFMQTGAAADTASSKIDSSVSSIDKLVASIDAYKAALQTVNNITADGQAISEDYYNTLKEQLSDITVAEEGFSDAIDEQNGKYIVKNVALLGKLVKQSQKAQKATIQVAKAQAQTQYKSLTSQLQNNINALYRDYTATSIVSAATLANIHVLQGQIDTLKETIRQYALLELQMSGMTDGYIAFEEAKAKDEQYDQYGATMIEALKIIDKGLLEARLGTASVSAAIKAFVPEEALKNATTLKEEIAAIKNYIDGDKAFSDYFTVDKDGNFSVEAENATAFVKDMQKAGILTGENAESFGVSAEYAGDLNKAYEAFNKSLIASGESAGITKEAFAAMIAEVSQFSYGNRDILIELTTPKLEMDVLKATNGVEEVTDKMALFWKEAAANGTFDAEAYNKLQAELDESNQKLAESEAAANKNAQQYNLCQTVFSNLEGKLKLTADEANRLAISLGLVDANGNPNVSVNDDGTLQLTNEQIKLVVEQLAKLEEPTVMRMQLRYDEIATQIDTLQQYIDGKLNDPESNQILISLGITNVDAAKQKIDELKPEQSQIGITYGITETSSEQEKSVLESYKELAKNGLEFDVTADVTDVDNKIDHINNNNPENKEVLFVADASTASGVIKGIADQLSALPDDVSITIETKEKKTIFESIVQAFSGGSKTSTTSNNVIKPSKNGRPTMALGNAHANGNVGLKTSESNAVVGELGQELVVDPINGVYYTVGDNGTEIVDLPKGAIIYNHKQTQELLKNGHTSRGTYAGGLSFANGNAHAYDEGIITTYRGEGVDTAMKNGNAIKSAAEIAAEAAKIAADAADDMKDSADEFKETINWIEVLFTRIDNNLAEHEAYYETLTDTVGSIYSGAANAISITNAEIIAFGQQMQQAFNQTKVDLTKRPNVSGATMRQAGWNDANDDDYATVHTVTFTGSDFGLTNEYGKDFAINVTPILPDGTVINGGEDGLWEYINSSLDSGKSLEDLDVFLGSYETISQAVNEAEKLHEMQEKYYSMANEYENNSTSSLAEKESILKTMYTQLYNKASYSIDAAKYYSNLAESILAGMDAVIAEKVRNGTILIEEITDEALKENIDKALEYLDQSSQYTQQYYQTITEIADQAKEHLEDVSQAYENEIGLTEHLNDALEARNDLEEAREGFATKSYYNAQIGAQKIILDQLEEERDALQDVLDEEVRLGHVDIGDQQWFDMQQAIYDVDDAIIDTQASIEDLQNSINDLHWDRFDELINRFGYIEEEISNVIQLISHDPDGLIQEELSDLTTDNWATGSGLTTIGLYAQEMERAQYVANEYAQAINDLKKDYAAGKYNETEYLNKLNELISAQYENIEKYYDAKDAIIELNEARVDAIRDGIEKEIDAYQELIDKKKELLDREKNLHDFNNEIEEKEKEVSDIRKQLAAMDGDDTAATVARKKQLQEELVKAEKSLEESYYDHSISARQEALDKEFNAFETEKNAEIQKWEEWLLNIETVVSESLTYVKENTNIVCTELTTLGQQYGLTMSDSLTTPWQNGQNAIDNYSTTFEEAKSKFTSMLDEISLHWSNVTAEAEKAAAAQAKALQSEYEKTVSKIPSTVNTNKNKKPSTPTPKPTTPTPTPTPTPVQQPKQEAPKQISVGGKINAGSALIYEWAGDTTGERQYFRNDPIYTVLKTQGDWVQVRHHKLSKGITGWFKKSDVKAYASGLDKARKDHWAIINELGSELQMIPGQRGNLEYVKYGTSILPHDVSAKLMQLALDPTSMFDDAKTGVKVPTIETKDFNYEFNFDSLLHVDNASNDSIPALQKMIRSEFNNMMKQVNNGLKRSGKS